MVGVCCRVVLPDKTAGEMVDRTADRRAEFRAAAGRLTVLPTAGSTRCLVRCAHPVREFPEFDTGFHAESQTGFFAAEVFAAGFYAEFHDFQVFSR